MIDVVLHQTVRYRGHLDRNAVTELLAEHCKAGIGQLADLDDEQLAALVSAAFAVGNCELQEAVFDMIEKNNEVTRNRGTCTAPLGGSGGVLSVRQVMNRVLAQRQICWAAGR